CRWVTISSIKPAISRSAAQLEALDRRHVIHPHQRSVRTQRRVMVRGEGSTVWDANGRGFIDAIGGGIWVAQVGHGRRARAGAPARQRAESPHFTGFFESAKDRRVARPEGPAELAPGDVTRVYFTTSGPGGVDPAIKVARLYHTHRGQPYRNWIIARHY